MIKTKTYQNGMKLVVETNPNALQVNACSTLMLALSMKENMNKVMLTFWNICFLENQQTREA